MTTVSDFVMAKRNLYLSGAEEFKATFGVPLKRFWDNPLGLDIIAFDEYLKTPDGVSTRDHIAKNYGESAVNLVMSLL